MTNRKRRPALDRISHYARGDAAGIGELLNCASDRSYVNAMIRKPTKSLRDYLNHLPLAADASPAEPLPPGLRDHVLARMRSRVYGVGLEDLARTLDDSKGMPARSTLAAFLKVLRPLVEY